VALVSDAGTPVVSDPGSTLVAAAHAAGIRVEPIPGPSAAIASLSVSGFADQEFTFVGFPPSRSKARTLFFARLATEPRTLILYEAPHRIRACLEEMLLAFGDRELLVARELTKKHETLAVSPISQHLAALSEERGEFTLVVRGSSEEKHRAAGPPQRPNAEAMAREFGDLTNNKGLNRRAALKQLADRYRIPSREVYALLEQAKHSAE